MPSWGGKNRPLPDTGKCVNMPGQQQDFAAPYKDGWPLRKAAQEGKADKDTEDALVKLDRVVELLDHGLLSVREYELLKQSINQPFIVLTETKFSYCHIPVWARYSPHRTRVEAHANTLSP